MMGKSAQDMRKVQADQANGKLLLVRDLAKEFQGPGEKLSVLNGLNFSLPHGESVAILGASGCGKSTLLHILGTLDTPTRGEVWLDGREVGGLTSPERARVRNAEIGFVFQFHHLLSEFTTLENVAMPGIIQGLPRSKAMGMAREALELVGLAERLEHRVTTLSGGERQRAAIARAILLRPRVLLADEPTGNLDEKTGEKVGDILLDLNREVGMALVIVTHNSELAGLMHRRYELKAGELYEQSV